MSPLFPPYGACIFPLGAFWNLKKGSVLTRFQQGGQKGDTHSVGYTVEDNGVE